MWWSTEDSQPNRSVERMLGGDGVPFSRNWVSASVPQLRSSSRFRLPSGVAARCVSGGDDPHVFLGPACIGAKTRRQIASKHPKSRGGAKQNTSATSSASRALRARREASSRDALGIDAIRSFSGGWLSPRRQGNPREQWPGDPWCRFVTTSTTYARRSPSRWVARRTRRGAGTFPETPCERLAAKQTLTVPLPHA